MREALALVLFLGISACGGKVVVDPPGSGGGSTGTSSTTGTTTTTVDLPTCGSVPVTCGIGSGGECDCSAMCSQQKLEVRCDGSSSASACKCTMNDIDVAACADNGHGCDLAAGCCAEWFFTWGG